MRYLHPHLSKFVSRAYRFVIYRKLAFCFPEIEKMGSLVSIDAISNHVPFLGFNSLYFDFFWRDGPTLIMGEIKERFENPVEEQLRFGK